MFDADTVERLCLDMNTTLHVYKVSGIYAAQADLLLDLGQGVLVFPGLFLDKDGFCRRRRAVQNTCTTRLIPSRLQTSELRTEQG